MTLVANPLACSRSALQGGEPRATGWSDGCPSQALGDPGQVNGDRRDHMLEAGFGQSDVAALAQPAAADGLRVGAFDPRARAAYWARNASVV